MDCTVPQATSNEIWDVLDENRRPTGRCIERGRPLREGDYHLAAFAYLRRSDGRYLITKRSPEKETHPGMWEFPHGAAVSGENSLDAAIRECSEECGLALSRENAMLVYSHKSENLFSDHFLFRQEFDLAEIVMQPSEVCDARAAMPDDVRALVVGGEMQGYYLDMIEIIETIEKAGAL